MTADVRCSTTTGLAARTSASTAVLPLERLVYHFFQEQVDTVAALTRQLRGRGCLADADEHGW